MLHFYLMFFISIRERVGVWVVEKGTFAIAPWKTLGANTKVIIFDEFWLLVVSTLVRQDAIYRA